MSHAYYNENDSGKAAWLRELMKAGVIASGEVDERSIEQVEPEDLEGFSQCHWFAGIGVWSYALRLAGWPDDRAVWTGSCPCPSFSAAGKGQGFDDPRHLWPHWYRLIRKRKPPVVFGEQADDAIGFGWLDLVQAQLEAEAYAVGPVVLGACSVGGSDMRQRLWFVADRMAESCNSFGREIVQGHGCHGAYGRRPQTHGELGTCRQVYGVGIANGSGSQPREQGSPPMGHGSATEPAGSSQRLDDSHSGRQPMHRTASGQTGHVERSGEVERMVQPEHGGRQGRGSLFGGTTATLSSSETYLRGFWANADWVLRRKGNGEGAEWCPVEPGTFPLAHGVANRVLKLRGYGDAINAQVAKAFIQAYIEARSEVILCPTASTDTHP